MPVRDGQPLSRVRTVLGDVPPAALGRTDYHEHLFQVSPLLPGDELDDESASGVEAGQLRASGIDTMIDATPIGLGRRPAAVARISAATGLRVVASTGAHREPHYPRGHWLLERSESELADRFVVELTEGLPATDREPGGELARGPGGRPVRAGMIKTGIGYWSVSAHQRRVLAAAATAHARTGAPVMVHLEHGSAGPEVLELLLAAGVPADSVVLAHVDRNPDPGLHAELAAAGAYLGYDGFARSKLWPDSVLLDCLRAAAERGAAERLVIGGDVARRTRYLAYGGMPGLAYLGRRVVPRLEQLDAELAVRVLVDNPARLLTWRTPTAGPAGREESA